MRNGCPNSPNHVPAPGFVGAYAHWPDHSERDYARAGHPSDIDTRDPTELTKPTVRALDVPAILGALPWRAFRELRAGRASVGSIPVRADDDVCVSSLAKLLPHPDDVEARVGVQYGPRGCLSGGEADQAFQFGSDVVSQVGSAIQEAEVAERVVYGFDPRPGR